MIAAGVARLGIVLISFVLLWRIVVVNAVLYDERGVPRLAPSSTAVPAPAVSDTDALQRVLWDNPAEGAALLFLARNLEIAGNLQLASRAYRAALEIAPFDRPSLEAAAAFMLRSGDAAATELLARLVGNFPQAREAGFATLAAMLASQRHRPVVVKALAAHPDWESDFLAHACRAGADRALLHSLLSSRARTGKPVIAEAKCLIDRLKKEGQWSQAHQLWLNLLPRNRLANVGYVFNGGFEDPLDPFGFDWSLAQGAERETGHTAEIRAVAGASGKAALRVAYNGRRQFGAPVLQNLALPPGRYELSGLVRSEGLKSLRGIQWTVRCLTQEGPGTVLGHSERFLGSSEWRAFAGSVEVGRQCEAQILQLEPAIDGGTLVFISGSVWFDELKLRLAPI